jgi:predicted transcriptional regulator
MNLTIELSDEQGAALKTHAEAQGLTVELWLQKIAENYAPPRSFSHLQKTNPTEWAHRFHEWAESHDRTTPSLSEEAISRESIYTDRI